MNIDDMAAEYEKLLLNGFTPEVMVIAYPEGTWLLRKGEEPRFLGEEKDFEPIMFEMLGIKNFGT